MQRGGRLTPAEISFEGKHWLLKFQLLPSFPTYSLQNHSRDLKILQYRHSTKQLEMFWSADHVCVAVCMPTLYKSPLCFFPPCYCTKGLKLLCSNNSRPTNLEVDLSDIWMPSSYFPANVRLGFGGNSLKGVPWSMKGLAVNIQEREAARMKFGIL